MGFYDLDKIVTEKTEKNRAQQIKETAGELRDVLEIIAQTQLRIKEPVCIDRYTNPKRVCSGEDYNYGELFLTQKGLEEVTGRWAPGEMGSGSYEHEPEKIISSDCGRIVEQYSLTTEDIDHLRSKLKNG